MYKLRDKIKPGRNKLVAHAGRAPWLCGLAGVGQILVRVEDVRPRANDKVLGTPFEIDVTGVPGDAEMLLKSLRQSGHFETPLASKDKHVQDACLALALPATGPRI